MKIIWNALMASILLVCSVESLEEGWHAKLMQNMTEKMSGKELDEAGFGLFESLIHHVEKLEDNGEVHEPGWLAELAQEMSEEDLQEAWFWLIWMVLERVEELGGNVGFIEKLSEGEYGKLYEGIFAKVAELERLKFGKNYKTIEKHVEELLG